MLCCNILYDSMLLIQKECFASHLLAGCLGGLAEDLGQGAISLVKETGMACTRERVSQA